jgi:hypothetical protein
VRTALRSHFLHARDHRHIASELLLPSAQSGRVFGTGDRTHGHAARATGEKSHHSFAATVGLAAM